MRYLVLFLLLASGRLFGQREDFKHIDFNKADSTALSLKGESLSNLPVLTHKLTAHLLTEVEKFRAIYTWVSTNIENDYTAYIRTSSKRKKLSEDREAYLEWNNDFTPKMFEKMRSSKKTACTGYAYLIRELSSLVGIDCKIVDGHGRTANLDLTPKSPANHSWNAAKLNDRWYLCDATWSAGRVMLEDDGPKFESDYHDGYFLADPALFVKNHYPLQTDMALLDAPPTFDTFLAGPIVYKEAFAETIIPIEPSTMHFEALKNEPVVFKIAASDSSFSEHIKLLLVNGNSSTSLQPEVSKKQGQYVLHHAFKKSGLYDVHIQVDNSIVVTYVVRVKRK